MFGALLMKEGAFVTCRRGRALPRRRLAGSFRRAVVDLSCAGPSVSRLGSIALGAAAAYHPRVRSLPVDQEGRVEVVVVWYGERGEAALAFLLEVHTPDEPTAAGDLDLEHRTG